MATFNSLQVAQYFSAQPMSSADERVVEALFNYGKLRILRIDWTSPAGVLVGDVVNLARIPQGKVTILGWLSQLRNGAFGASVTAAIGYSTYRDKLGNVIAASPAAFLAATSVTANGTLSLNPAAPASGFLGSGIVDVTSVPDQFFSSMSGLYITATFAGANPAAAQALTGGLVIAVE